MTNYKTGQDVVVEKPSLLGGEAFLAIVDEEDTISDENVYINLRERDESEAEIALISKEYVVTLTEVFDTIKSDTDNR